MNLIQLCAQVLLAIGAVLKLLIFLDKALRRPTPKERWFGVLSSAMSIAIYVVLLYLSGALSLLIGTVRGAP